MDPAPEVRLGADGCQLIFEGPAFAQHVGARIERGRFLRVGDSIVLDSTLPAYFAELGQSWRGWTGERVWQSAGEKLTLAARHDGIGHVLITVTIRNWDLRSERAPARTGDWSAAVVVEVEPAALEHIAAALEAIREADPDH